jgi:hypothetical protein
MERPSKVFFSSLLIFFPSSYLFSSHKYREEKKRIRERAELFTFVVSFKTQDPFLFALAVRYRELKGMRG